MHGRCRNGDAERLLNRVEPLPRSQLRNNAGRHNSCGHSEGGGSDGRSSRTAALPGSCRSPSPIVRPAEELTSTTMAAAEKLLLNLPPRRRRRYSIVPTRGSSVDVTAARQGEFVGYRVARAQLSNSQSSAQLPPWLRRGRVRPANMVLVIHSRERRRHCSRPTLMSFPIFPILSRDIKEG